MASRLINLPSSFKKIVVKKLTTNFAEATEIITAQMPNPKAGEVIIKSKYMGVNATDINITKGRYFVGSKPPFDCGLEVVGEVAALGSEVQNLTIGQPVAYIGIGAYSEYLCVPSKMVWPIPDVKPEFLAMLVSGRTALIGLDKSGFIKKNDRVLITAAAGGAGLFAVQYAKTANCHVIGTCSSDEKVELLKKLGCDRVINYKKEDLKQVLKEEYPNGIDVIWETIGGDIFETCLENLAIRGRLIIVGYISNYKPEEGIKPSNLSMLPQKLLMTSGSVSGFLLTHFVEEFPYYHAKLLGMYEKDRIKILMDRGDKTSEGQFKGLESVTRAVEYLHGGTSIGKVYVEI